jgi:hypothetical protein
MKKSKETQKLTFHTFIDKKKGIILLAFFFIFTGKVFPNSWLPQFLMEEGEYVPITLIGFLEHKLNENNEMKYFFFFFNGNSIIIRTYFVTPITEFDIPDFLGQTDIIHIEPIEVFEIEIEFTEKCPLERLLKVFHTRWGYITEGILFFRALDNGQKKFIIKLERIDLNG